MSIKEILVLHHSHTDQGFNHHPDITLPLQASYLDQAMELCEANRNTCPVAGPLRWTVESHAPLVYWLNNAEPDEKARLRGLAEEGLIDCGTIGWHTTPLARTEQWKHMLEPVLEFRKQLSMSCKTAVQFDVNGLPWGVLPLFKDFDIDTLMMGLNIDHGGFPGKRHDMFYWMAPNEQSKVLVYNGDHYGTFQRVFDLRHDVTLEEMQKGFAAYQAMLERKGYDRDFVVLTATLRRITDCNPPWALLPEKVAMWNAAGLTPKIRFATLDTVRSRLHDYIKTGVDIPAVSGDWTDYWIFGTGSTAMATTASRRAKQRLELSQRLPIEVNDRWTKVAQEAQDHLVLFDEHTWGAIHTSAYANRTSAWGQDVSNQAHAATALGQAEAVLRQRLEQIAKNPREGHGCSELLLVNPDAVDRWVWPRVKGNWLDGSWSHNHIEMLLSDDEISHADEPVYRMQPVCLPANSTKRIPIKEIDTSPAANCQVSENSVETPFHKLTWDSQTGQIQTFEQLNNSLAWLDTHSVWPTFSIVHETVDSNLPAHEQRQLQHHTDFDLIHENISCWKPDWPAKRQVLDELLSCEVEHDAAGLHLCRRWKFGMEYWAELILHLSPVEPAVGITLRANLPEQQRPNALYIPFPLNLDMNWQATFDSVSTDIKLDEQQMLGTNRDWVTVDRKISYEDIKQRITLHCPDAPLVMTNGFGFALHRSEIPRNANPLLLAWITNNYWDTNTPASQTGYLEAGWWLEQGKPEMKHAVRHLPPNLDFAHPCVITDNM